MSILKKNILSVLLIMIVSVIIYANTFDVPFYLDDNHAIENNSAISQFDIKRLLFSSPRPVLDVTFAINYYFGKLDVFGYHLVNVLLHMANGVMVYFILLWTINLASDGMSDTKIPLYAALIFIVHPVQTQAVTYIVSRSSVLTTFFYLLSFILFIRAFRHKTGRGNRGMESGSPLPCTMCANLLFAGAFVSSCLAMGTKPIAATLPVMLLIFDFYFISDGNGKVMRRHYGIHLLMFLTIIITVYLNVSGLREFVSFEYIQEGPVAETVVPGALKPEAAFPARKPAITSFQYFLTQMHVIPYYIKLLFVPAGLNLDYDWPITRRVDVLTAVYFILISSIIVIAIALFNRSRVVSFGIIWFFVTLSVTSSFIALYDVIFEHRLYLPSVGFAVVLAVMISNVSKFGRKPDR